MVLNASKRVLLTCPTYTAIQASQQISVNKRKKQKEKKKKKTTVPINTTNTSPKYNHISKKPLEVDIHKVLHNKMAA